MDADHLGELIELEETYWWHVAKRRLALKLLARYAPPPGLLIEGGIGSCRNLLELQRQGYEVAGLDVMPEAVALARERGLERVCLQDLAEPWPFDSGSARAIVLLDVLEHMADPVAALSHAHCILAPGGAVILTVPAYGWLYGEWDRSLGHHRRYTARLLCSQAQEAGFQVRLLTHWNSFTLPAAVAVRGFQRLRPRPAPAEFPRVSAWTNRLLLGCAGAETQLEQFTDATDIERESQAPQAVLDPPFDGHVARAADSGSLRRPSGPECVVSVVLPVFNELGVLDTLVDALEDILTGTGCRYEIVFVNDGSTDGSAERLDELAVEHPCIRVIHFSRNFGHQAALHAGLAHSRGDAIVVMDSDLQDDPAAIRVFLDRWRAGYDVVYAERADRKEHILKRGLFLAFYRLLNAIADIRMPMDAGNFGLIDRRVADQITAVIDSDRYYPGLRSWVGFRQTGVPVSRGRRYDDSPRVSLRGLFRLAKTAIFSFSSVPLSMFYVIAGLSLATCFAVAAFALYHKLFTGLAIPGWASVTIIASFFGALNALGIGILGEYAIRIYDQVRARPHYIVARTTTSRVKASVTPAETAREV
jgi:dolichol-phosphate mannosyltransferase